MPSFFCGFYILITLTIFASFRGSGIEKGRSPVQSREHDRWRVKTLDDKGISQISPIPSSIKEQVRLHPLPKGVWNRDLPRRPDEMLVYSIRCYITCARFEKEDGDYHLTLECDGYSMTGEIPDPNACQGPTWKVRYANSRHLLDSLFGGRRSRRVGRQCREHAPVFAKVIGVGFWDKASPIRSHSENGALNGRELHPILGIELEGN